VEVRIASPPPRSLAATTTTHRATLWIGAVQLPWLPDLNEMIASIEDGVARAVAAGAQIVCLQELTLSPYFCTSPISPEVESPFTRWLKPEVLSVGPTLHLARTLAQRHGVYIHASLFEATGNGHVTVPGAIERGFNTAICVAPDGSIVSSTRKVHIPVTAGYREDLFFIGSDASAADGSTPLIATKARFGFPTCWDQWNVELSRCYALAGADILVYPTAIGSEPDHPDFDTAPCWQVKY
jgi:N-carbamoylputrescine amidase